LFLQGERGGGVLGSFAGRRKGAVGHKACGGLCREWDGREKKEKKKVNDSQFPE